MCAALSQMRNYLYFLDMSAYYKGCLVLIIIWMCFQLLKILPKCNQWLKFYMPGVRLKLKFWQISARAVHPRTSVERNMLVCVF